MTDIGYINSVIKGDREAYAYLVDKYKSMVYSVAYRMVHNHEDAEELTQDAFLKAYRSLVHFERKSKFSTWLYRIVYNAAISFLRKRKIDFAQIDPLLIENYSDDDLYENLNQLDENEIKMLAEHILKNLNPEDNALITLYYTDDCSISEIAEVTGWTQSNVKVKLHRIRKYLFVKATQARKKIEI